MCLRSAKGHNNMYDGDILVQFTWILLFLKIGKVHIILLYFYYDKYLEGEGKGCSCSCISALKRLKIRRFVE